MKDKEEIINEIEIKSRILYKKMSISDLEKILKEFEKAIKKVEYIEKIVNTICEKNDN